MTKVNGWDERDYKLWSEIQQLPSYGLLPGKNNRMISFAEVVKLMESQAESRASLTSATAPDEPKFLQIPADWIETVVLNLADAIRTHIEDTNHFPTSRYWLEMCHHVEQNASKHSGKAVKRTSATEGERNIEHKYRELLWLSHGHGNLLYGDDGEMQCNGKNLADFKRDPLEGLEKHCFEAKVASLSERATAGVGTESLIDACKTFIANRGKHVGEHEYDPTVQHCLRCEQAYIEAEAIFDSAVARAAPSTEGKEKEDAKGN